MGLTTPAGLLAEEYNYTPYGRVVAKRHTAFGDADGDGDVDAADLTAWQATPGDDGLGTYNRNFDADWDGDNGNGGSDNLDKLAYEANYLAAGTSIEVSGRAWSPNGNPYTYTARELLPETLLMHYRARTYHPVLKQFMQRDPLGYIDGANAYLFVLNNPLMYVDPFGLYGFADLFLDLTGGHGTTFLDRWAKNYARRKAGGTGFGGVGLGGARVPKRGFWRMPGWWRLAPRPVVTKTIWQLHRLRRITGQTISQARWLGKGFAVVTIVEGGIEWCYLIPSLVETIMEE